MVVDRSPYPVSRRAPNHGSFNAGLLASAVERRGVSSRLSSSGPAGTTARQEERRWGGLLRLRAVRREELGTCEARSTICCLRGSRFGGDAEVVEHGAHADPEVLVVAVAGSECRRIRSARSWSARSSSRDAVRVRGLLLAGLRPSPTSRVALAAPHPGSSRQGVITAGVTPSLPVDD